MKQIIILLVLLCGLSAFAQAPSVESVAPVLSELDKSRLDTLALTDALAQTQGLLAVCQGQLAPQTYQQAAKDVATRRAQLVSEFDAAHPGWTIDPKTGAVVKKNRP